MRIIYLLFTAIITTSLYKKPTPNHKYSINGVIEHLKTIKKIKFTPTDFVIAEMNKATKILVAKKKTPFI